MKGSSRAFAHFTSGIKMPITILNPQPAPQRPPVAADSDSDSDSNGGANIQENEEDGDDIGDEILTPGTVITSNPQWMR